MNELINKKPISDQIMETIRKRIVNKKYPAGYRLKEKELTKEFGVSNIPVREALKILRYQGFISITSYKGAEVVDFNDPKYIKDLYEVRTMIECFAVEKTIKNLDSEGIKKMEICLDNIKKAKNMGHDVMSLDPEFHREIIELSDNAYLLRLFDRIQFQRPMLDSNSRKKMELGEYISLSYEEHKEIFDYIIAKDKNKAKKAIAKHLSLKK